MFAFIGYVLCGQNGQLMKVGSNVWSSTNVVILELFSVYIGSIDTIKNGYLVGKYGFTYLEKLYLKADAKLCVITMLS